MENASKALIIAGAILIAIVLITIGVGILRQGDEMSDSGVTVLNSREIESFNSQFQKYQGTAITGTNVRALINAVNSNNAAQANSGGGHYIQLTGITAITGVRPASKYTVTMTDTATASGADVANMTFNGSPDGFIDTINIVANP